MKRNLTIFMSCTGIILLLAGARWDLAISDALYAPDHLFAILLQDGWPLIMKLMLALCFALIADSRPAAYIGWGGATLLFAQEASRIFPRPSASVTVLLAMACALFLCLFLRRRLSPAQKARIRPFLIAYLQLLFTVLIIVAMQLILHRRALGGDAYCTQRLVVVFYDSEGVHRALETLLDHMEAQILESDIERREDGPATYRLTVRSRHPLDFQTMNTFLSNHPEIQRFSV